MERDIRTNLCLRRSRQRIYRSHRAAPRPSIGFLVIHERSYAGDPDSDLADSIEILHLTSKSTSILPSFGYSRYPVSASTGLTVTIVLLRKRSESSDFFR